MADPVLEGLLSHYQRLRVATSTRRTYQAGIKALHQFCAQYTILLFPASPLTLRYFCCYMACQVSYKTILLIFALNTFEDPTKDELLQLLCTGIKRSQSAQTCTRLPIAITVLQTLKSQLRLDSAFSPFEKHLLWAAFTMAFYRLLRASEFATPFLKWQHVQRTGNAYTIFIEQSIPFHCGHSIIIYASGTSTCPVKALQLYAEAVPEHQGNAPLFKGGRFSPLIRQ